MHFHVGKKISCSGSRTGVDSKNGFCILVIWEDFGELIAIAHQTPKMQWDAWKRLVIFVDFHPISVGIASFFESFANGLFCSRHSDSLFKSRQNGPATLVTQPCQVPVLGTPLYIQFCVQIPKLRPEAVKIYLIIW